MNHFGVEDSLSSPSVHIEGLRLGDNLGNKYSISLRPKCCQDANFVITGGTGGCHKDNLPCHQWWQSWHHDNPRISLSEFYMFDTNPLTLKLLCSLTWCPVICVAATRGRPVVRSCPQRLPVIGRVLYLPGCVTAHAHPSPARNGYPLFDWYRWAWHSTTRCKL